MELEDMIRWFHATTKERFGIGKREIWDKDHREERMVGTKSKEAEANEGNWASRERRTKKSIPNDAVYLFIF
jgi:hypothetical protein